MTYQVLELTGAQDFLHKVPAALQSHPGWTLVSGIVNEDVEHYIEQTGEFNVNGFNVIERGAVVVFSDFADVHANWGYFGFGFGSSQEDYAGCKFVEPKAVTRYRLQDANRNSAAGTTNTNILSQILANGGTTLTDWVLEYSDDGVAWSIADQRTNISWQQDEIKTFTVTPVGAHLYWRLRTIADEVQGIRRLEFSDNTGPITRTTPEYVFRYQGFGNFDDSLMGISMVQNKGDNVYSIRMDSFAAHSPESRVGEQYETRSTFLSLRSTPMQMHANINERRLCAGIHLGGLDATLYVGHFLPYATPEEYPYPVLMAGANDRGRAASFSGNASIAARAPGTRLRTPDGEWYELGHTTPPNFARSSTTPHWQVEPCGVLGWAQLTSWRFRQPVNGVYTLTPMIIVGNNVDWDGTMRTNYTLGELEGFNWIPSDEVVSGTTFTDAEGRDFRIFQSYGYTAQADYTALRIN